MQTLPFGSTLRERIEEELEAHGSGCYPSKFGNCVGCHVAEILANDHLDDAGLEAEVEGYLFSEQCDYDYVLWPATLFNTRRINAMAKHVGFNIGRAIEEWRADAPR